jgi:DNA helicase-2/ATP-dependent DNA helicase PcrA
LYRFAGAAPDYLDQRFEQLYPDGKLFKLTTNYRSTKAIVETMGRIVAPNYNETNQHLNKTLKARKDAPKGDPIKFTKLATPYQEGSYIAEQIEKLVADGYEYGDVFVVSRTRAYLQFVEGALAAQGIPYVHLRGASFWESGYVGKLLAYLRLGMNPHNNEAFEKVYNVASKNMRMPFNKGTKIKGVTPIPHRFLGKAFLTALKTSIPSFIADQLKGKREPSYYDGFDYIDGHGDSWRWAAGYTDLLNLIEQIKVRVDVNKESPAKILQFILDESIKQHAKLSEGVNQIDAAEDMFEEFATVVDIARQYKTCGEFIDYIDMLIKEAKKAKQGDPSKLVVLNTIHGVKGQERKIVFCPGWAEGVLPHIRSLEPKIDNSSILPTASMGLVEDERCVAFVAFSRAKEIVDITCPDEYMGKLISTSRFVSDLGLLNGKKPATLLYGKKEFKGFD